MSANAWVTLATNDSYGLGALVLGHSLRQTGTPHQLVVLITPGVTQPMRDTLKNVFNEVREVDILDSKDEANLKLLSRPELGVTFTKLHCWRLTQYQKCVFLDADTMVLQNSDELFEREELSAAPDVGWPDCFNSGVFVFVPSNETYNNLIDFALSKGSFDGGDQGLLNMYFSDWAHKDINKHLPFIYNMCSTACYSYIPAFKQFGSNVKIVHFIAQTKPWLQFFDPESRQVKPTHDLMHLTGLLQHWWNIFCSVIHPQLSKEMAPDKRPPAHNSNFFHNPKPNPIQHQNTNSNEPRYQVVWDPWEEYDKKKLEETQNRQIEQSNQINFDISTEISHNYFNPHIPEPQVLVTSHNINNNNQNFNKNEEYSPNTLTSHSVIETSFEKHDFSTDSNFNSQVIVEPETSTQFCQDNIHCNNSFVEHVKKDNFYENPTNWNPETNVPDSFPLPEPIIPYNSNVSSECVAKEFEQPFCEPASSITKEITLQPIGGDSIEGGFAGAFARLTLGEPRSEEQSALENTLRRQGWEVGNIDYLNRDSFGNIWNKICETLASGPNADNGKNKDLNENGNDSSKKEISNEPEQMQILTESVKEISTENAASPILPLASTESQILDSVLPPQSQITEKPAETIKDEEKSDSSIKENLKDVPIQIEAKDIDLKFEQKKEITSETVLKTLDADKKIDILPEIADAPKIESEINKLETESKEVPSKENELCITEKSEKVEEKKDVLPDSNEGKIVAEKPKAVEESEEVSSKSTLTSANDDANKKEESLCKAEEKTEMTSEIATSPTITVGANNVVETALTSEKKDCHKIQEDSQPSTETVSNSEVMKKEICNVTSKTETTAAEKIEEKANEIVEVVKEPVDVPETEQKLAEEKQSENTEKATEEPQVHVTTQDSEPASSKKTKETKTQKEKASGGKKSTKTKK